MADDNAEEAKAAEDGAASADDGKKSKKKLLILIIGALVLLGGGGAAAFLFLGSSPEEVAADSASEAEPAGPTADQGAVPPAGAEGKAAATPEEQKTADAGTGEEKANALPPGVDFGNTFSFKTFHLNLGNPLENHYIRLEIAVEFKGGEPQKKEIEQRLPQLRDAVVSVASRKTREFLLGPDGKDQLRREILIRMNRYMSQPLESVFITDVLIE